MDPINQRTIKNGLLLTFLCAFASLGNAYYIHVDPEVVPETYPTLNRRSLQENGGNSFMPLAVADKRGLVGPIRVHFVVVDPRSDVEGIQFNSCTAVGQKVNPCSQMGMQACPIDCTAEHVVTQQTIDVIKKRLEWLSSFLSTTFRMKTSQSGVTIRQTVRDKYPHAQLNDNYDADVVVIVTLQPAHIDGIVGYAMCPQRDNYGRCTVGIFNWMPERIEPTKSTMAQVIQSNRHTALHELLHVLGGIKIDLTYQFRDPTTGAALPSNKIYIEEIDPGYPGKAIRKLITPRVLNMAREQFGCPSLTGMPIEDDQMGAGTHWEARVMGPDMLSYGSSAGEVYLSSLTLAFFEDTNQYYVNYTMAGRLLEVSASTADEKDYMMLPFLESDVDISTRGISNIEGNTHADMYPDGALRWGWKQGCDFVTGSAKDWPKEYICDDASTYGCTADYLMSARCSVREYGAKASNTQASRTFACTRTSSKYCTPNSRYPYLPTDYNYFGNEKAGFNPAMDYAPIKLGFWNCRDVRLSQREAVLAAGDYVVDYGDLFDEGNRIITERRGQINGAASRCFESSLLSLAQSATHLVPDSPAFGLCYAANCPSKTYLQFGIQTWTGVYWYGCHEAGAKIYIPGFIGSLTCPNSTTFCSHPVNTVLLTGKMFPETDPVLEMIFWGFVFSISILFAIVLYASEKINRLVTGWLSAFCGLASISRKMIPKEGSEEQDDDRKESIFHSDYESTWKSRLLLGINCAFFFSSTIGILIASLAIVLPYEPKDGELHWPVPTLGSKGVLLSFGVFLVSVLGCLAALFGGPSLKLLFYFYIVFAATLLLGGAMLALTGVHTLSLTLSELILTNFWFVFPYQWLALPADQAMMELNEWMHTNGWAVWLTLVVVFIALVIALVCSGLLLTLENLLGNFLFMFSLGCIAVGLYLTIIQSRVLAALPAESRSAILVLALIPCIVMIIVGFFGAFACGRHKRIFWFTFSAGALALVSGMFGVLVICVEKLPHPFVSGLKSSNNSVMHLNDDDWIAISGALGTQTSWNTKDLFEVVTANQTAMGISLVIFAVFVGVFVLPVSGRAYKNAKEHATSDEESVNDGQNKAHFDSVETVSKGRRDAPPSNSNDDHGKDVALEMTGMDDNSEPSFEFMFTPAIE